MIGSNDRILCQGRLDSHISQAPVAACPCPCTCTCHCHCHCLWACSRSMEVTHMSISGCDSFRKQSCIQETVRRFAHVVLRRSLVRFIKWGWGGWWVCVLGFETSAEQMPQSREGARNLELRSGARSSNWSIPIPATGRSFRIQSGIGKGWMDLESWIRSEWIGKR